MIRSALIPLALIAAACGRAPDRLVVAAASDLTQALPELAAAFGQETLVEVSPTFAASKVLASQLEAGAPFDLFMSADTRLVDELVARGLCEASAVYGHGHLVMWVRAGAPPAAVDALADPRYARVAIANPETAPYGFAARTALERAGVLASVEPRLVRGESVRHALQLTSSGNAEVAVIAQSLAIAGPGAWTVVPAALHDPIVQSLAVCGARRGSARAFAAFVTGPRGRAILARWGLAPDHADPR
ncbi:MAG: molybdate ABC transporter substrate-binding protein [Deltaproteobacteria bacterium]|nr:molybdate ABC transporter substrate-binding protein [Deltaproteobacteria bacterium]